MVSNPVCHTADRGSIPQQRELLEPNTRFHQTTVSTLDVSNIKPEKNMADDRKENESGNDKQPNMSLSFVVSIPVCHNGERVRFPESENF